MAKTKNVVVSVSPEVRERWAAMETKDYETLNAEYLRQILLLQERATKATDSIRSWVAFFGIVCILWLIFSFFNFFLSV